MFGVSRWTINRRVKTLNLLDLKGFSEIEDDQLDQLVKQFLPERGNLAGQTMLIRFLRSCSRQSRKCSLEMGSYHKKKNVQCALAKFALAS